ncbi:MAG: pyridoxamine 5'-phosphate oxidase family protein [Chloroflexi bacterium]|nr:pyridoxamine 5'-phosphate oxidase family protein [Chloroflexota bacterium]
MLNPAQSLVSITEINMLDYARQRAKEALMVPRTAILATSGPAGVQVSEVPCQALDLDFYLLVPQTSDHLFNLEHDPAVTLLTAGWALKGQAHIISGNAPGVDLNLLREPGAEWCLLVRVDPCQVQIRRVGGWGHLETIDLKSR